MTTELLRNATMIGLGVLALATVLFLADCWRDIQRGRADDDRD